MTDAQPFTLGLNYWPHHNELNLSARTDTSDAAAAQVARFNDLGALEHDNSIPAVQIKTKIVLQHTDGIMFRNLDKDSWGARLAHNC